jgi:hypothetical protein
MTLDRRTFFGAVAAAMLGKPVQATADQTAIYEMRLMLAASHNWNRDVWEVVRQVEVQIDRRRGLTDLLYGRE